MTPPADASPTGRPWLVTRAAGFLGSHVVALDGLQRGGLEFLETSLEHNSCSLVVADTRDADATERLFARVRPVERAHLQADVTRLREINGWVPNSDLGRGLASLLEGEGVRLPEGPGTR